MSESEPKASSDNLASPVEADAGDSATNTEDFKPFTRKRFWRGRPDSSQTPQESPRPPDETASEK
jgi:hypothetical protein